MRFIYICNILAKDFFAVKIVFPKAHKKSIDSTFHVKQFCRSIKTTKMSNYLKKKFKKVLQ